MNLRTCIALTALLTATSADAAINLVTNGKSDYAIVLPEKASPSQKRGADELREHIKQLSGAELAIVSDSAPANAHEIVLGIGRRAPTARIAVDPKSLGHDGFVLKTKGEKIYILGAPVRGTMYGCSDLLERLGVRWLTSKVTVLPKSPELTLPDIDDKQIPSFEYREPYTTEAFDKDWAARNRVNGHTPRLDESTGGHVVYADFVHTFDRLIPPTLYKQHPEYFPLVDGKRVDGYVQRCLTSPDVLKIAIEGVRNVFKNNPAATLTSVSQNDNETYCRCEQCTKIANRYGGQSGLYLWFVNQVAAAIEHDYPDKLIDTLAYQFTEAPPTGIHPRRNVRVRLCPIYCCEAHVYDQCSLPANAAFVKRLNDWSKVTDVLYIWHYDTNFPHYLMPFPDFKQFPASARMYRTHGVKGVFFQCAYAPGGGGADAELRAYVMAKLLWNVNVDPDVLVNEWLHGVYGDAAAKPMRAYFDLVHEPFKNPNTHLNVYDDKAPNIFNDDLIAHANTLFDQAEKLVHTDLQREYVKKARLQVRYLELVHHPQAGEKLASFIADCKSLGITQLDESHPIANWEAKTRAAAAK
jgi:hypothetical protein